MVAEKALGLRCRVEESHCEYVSLFDIEQQAWDNLECQGWEAALLVLSFVDQKSAMTSAVSAGLGGNLTQRTYGNLTPAEHVQWNESPPKWQPIGMLRP